MRPSLTTVTAAVLFPNAPPQKEPPAFTRLRGAAHTHAGRTVLPLHRPHNFSDRRILLASTLPASNADILLHRLLFNALEADTLCRLNQQTNSSLLPGPDGKPTLGNDD